MDWSDVYKVVFWVVAVPVFIGCYIYSIATYGFLLGVGLGWLPSLIVAMIAGFLWPLLVGGALLIYLFSAIK